MYLTRSRPNAGLSIIMAGLLGLLGCLLAFLARSPSAPRPGAVELPLSTAMKVMAWRNRSPSDGISLDKAAKNMI